MHGGAEYSTDSGFNEVCAEMTLNEKGLCNQFQNNQSENINLKIRSLYHLLKIFQLLSALVAQVHAINIFAFVTVIQWKSWKP